MRIIGGKNRGRTLLSPKGALTRPTQDRVRESIFNILEQVGMWDTRVLDLFAGTGALALEALSRGAAFAVAVDVKTGHTIKQNSIRCQTELSLKVLSCDVTKALYKLSQQGVSPFDYVFIDPPYRKNLVPPMLKLLKEYRLLAPNACLIVEQAAEEVLQKEDEYVVVRQKRYGDTLVTFLKYIGKEA